MAELDEIFDSFACVICYRQYDIHLVPKNICPNNHLICEGCFQDILTNGNSIFYGSCAEEDEIQCPICRQTLELMKIREFKKLYQIKQAVSKIKNRQIKNAKQIQIFKNNLQKCSQQNQELRKNIVHLNKKVELKQIQLKEIKDKDALKKLSSKKRLKIEGSFYFHVGGSQQSQKKLQKQQSFLERRDHSGMITNSKRNIIDDIFILEQKLKNSHQIIRKMINILMQLQGKDSQRIKIKYNQIKFEDIQKIMNNFQKYFAECKEKVQKRNIQFRQMQFCSTRAKSAKKERSKRQQKPLNRDYSEQKIKNINKLEKNAYLLQDYTFHQKNKNKLSDFLLEKQPTLSKLKAAPKTDQLFKKIFQKTLKNQQAICKSKGQIYQQQIKNFQKSAKKYARK